MKRQILLGLVLAVMTSSLVHADNRRSPPQRQHNKPGQQWRHPAPAQRSAHPIHKSPYRQQSPGYSRDYYRPGYKTRYLPHGSHKLRVDRHDYYYFDGYFYQPFSHQFQIVAAPIGAIVLSLPRLHFSVSWNGLNYFVAGDTYYRPHPRGYIVVPNPGFSGWR